jgi:HPt (histidine-containing phosphotransfer) domain-containing protein
MSATHTGAPVDIQFFARLAQLQDQFASGVPATLQRLAGIRAAFDPAAPDLGLVDEMQAVLHTMAGSAATFNFRVLGHQARALEQRLRVLMAFDSIAEGDWNTWFDDLDAFVSWGSRDPKGAYYRGELTE